MIPGFGAGDHFFVVLAHCLGCRTRRGHLPAVSRTSCRGLELHGLAAAGPARRLQSGGTLTRTRRGNRTKRPEMVFKSAPDGELRCRELPSMRGLWARPPGSFRRHSLASEDVPHPHRETGYTYTHPSSDNPIVWHIAVHCLDTVLEAAIGRPELLPPVLPPCCPAIVPCVGAPGLLPQIVVKGRAECPMTRGQRTRVLSSRALWRTDNPGR